MEKRGKRGGGSKQMKLLRSNWRNQLRRLSYIVQYPSRLGGAHKAVRHSTCWKKKRIGNEKSEKKNSTKRCNSVEMREYKRASEWATSGTNQRNGAAGRKEIKENIPAPAPQKQKIKQNKTKKKKKERMKKNENHRSSNHGIELFVSRQQKVLQWRLH